ncbi:MAG: bifunctional 3-deoxy-7-phosphoheptulonate synthase/chorismate mutase type II [Bacteroidales bacterium]|nr:bifunctional 3-deoxy-7-phosphoheptulonate synthase/chorismate mutase type II [Bacteroidales bacterium]MDD3990497.1 bifunctional 3-deoxy-7-phosphoheptulonate synthase/chorismate mutase type II [Bacteroidales bacterium]
MIKVEPLKIDNLSLSRPIVIAGPCSAENPDQLMATAKELSKSGVKFFRAGIWKPRTKPGSFEGIGDSGLKWLRAVREETGMLTCTEVANAGHIALAIKEGIDILWIGARTTANPFAVQEIADALKGVDIPVLVKNPVNPDLELWIGALERLMNAGITRIAAVHRGFSSYERGLFRNRPLWHIPIELRRLFPSLTLLCDPSHIGGHSGLIESISQQAMDLGFDGLMTEVHIDPSKALSDKDQQITPSVFAGILSRLVIRQKESLSKLLEELRRELDELDDNLINILSRRMAIAREIGHYKIKHDMPVLQPARYEKMVTERVEYCSSAKLDRQFLKLIMEAIHEESVRQQLEIFDERYRKQ